MKIKTSELTGAALDWAVAQAKGLKIKVLRSVVYDYNLHEMEVDSGAEFTPSTDWQQGGSIIEREKIATGYDPFGKRWQGYEEGGHIIIFGATPLIAAMRCYVASKLGDEVEVPDAIA